MRALNRASELIGSFKRVAVDRSSDHRRQFMPRDLPCAVCLTLEPMYKNTPFKLQLDIEHDASWTATPAPWGQVITNFVSNAMQHGFWKDAGRSHAPAGVPEGSEPSAWNSATTALACPTGAAARVRSRSSPPSSVRGGSGLGTNIVYNIVRDVLGGHITINSGARPGHLHRGGDANYRATGQSASPGRALRPAAP